SGIAQSGLALGACSGLAGCAGAPAGALVVDVDGSVQSDRLEAAPVRLAPGSSASGMSVGSAEVEPGMPSRGRRTHISCTRFRRNTSQPFTWDSAIGRRL